MSKTPTEPRGARPIRPVLAAFAALLFAVAAWAGWLVPEPDTPQIPAASTPAVVISPAVGAGGAPAVVVAPKAEVQKAADGLDSHLDGADATPPGVSPEALAKAEAEQDRQAKTDALPLSPPDAAPSQAGCTSRFHLGSHTRGRGGLAPQTINLHETVSRNSRGPGDVNGIWTYFNRVKASAHFIIDREGNCIYAVRTVDTAWTQAAANRFSIGIEVINSASKLYDRNYIDGAGLKKLGRVVSDQAKEWGIPLQIGRVVGCVVVRKGIVTHKMLGACGGGHVDIDPFPEGLGQVLAAAKAYRAGEGKAAAARGKVCNQLRWHRGKAKAQGWTPERVARVQQLKKRAALQGLDANRCKA